jgi:hypothetical protein
MIYLDKVFLKNYLTAINIIDNMNHLFLTLIYLKKKKCIIILFNV